MSHFTTIQTQIRDLDALRDACGELGLIMLPNAKCRGYAGVTRRAPRVIQLKGPYDITVEAEGFQGKGCEAATKAIEEAIGKSTQRTRKPDFWRQSNRQTNQQQLGGELMPKPTRTRSAIQAGRESGKRCSSQRRILSFPVDSSSMRGQALEKSKSHIRLAASA